MQFVTFSYNT